ncbi:MAG TPA: PH domain-containing protein [Actinomycetota bacterium]
MAFPRRLLIEGEELILDLRPHWIALFWPVVATIAILVGMIWAYQATDVDWLDIAVGLIGLVLLVIYPVRKFVWWFTSNFAVTSDRVIHREGFIAKRSMEIPLEAINDVRFEQGIIDRMVGAGSLIISSASEFGRNEFEDIRHPEEVQKTIYHQGELNSQRMFTGGRAAPAAPAPTPPAPAPIPPAEPPVAAPAPAAPSATLELERLAKLRADGVLTEEEFQAQKAKILGQG